jgi:hypothetical protein
MAHCDFEDFEAPRMKINPLPDLGMSLRLGNSNINSWRQ